MKRGLKQGAKERERDREARECGEGTARNESHANAVFDKRVPAVCAVALLPRIERLSVRVYYSLAQRFSRFRSKLGE